MLTNIFTIAALPMTPIMTPSLGGFLTPINVNLANGIQEVSASFTPVRKTEILNKVTGRGLRVESRFTRSPHLVSASMVNLELTFTNEGNEPIKGIQTGNKVRQSLATIISVLFVVVNSLQLDEKFHLCKFDLCKNSPTSIC